jgi:NTP pyrophosphatase (non-canonical NTP hydrolase)
MIRPIPTTCDIPMHGWGPYSDMHYERIRAHAKHDSRDGSMERKSFDHPIWLSVLVEEIGEVARVLCDNELDVLDADVMQRLREELVQVGAMTAAWIDAIDEGLMPE